MTFQLFPSTNFSNSNSSTSNYFNDEDDYNLFSQSNNSNGGWVGSSKDMLLRDDESYQFPERDVADFLVDDGEEEAETPASFAPSTPPFEDLTLSQSSNIFNNSPLNFPIFDQDYSKSSYSFYPFQYTPCIASSSISHNNPTIPNFSTSLPTPLEYLSSRLQPSHSISPALLTSSHLDPSSEEVSRNTVSPKEAFLDFEEISVPLLRKLAQEDKSVKDAFKRNEDHHHVSWEDEKNKKRVFGDMLSDDEGSSPGVGGGSAAASSIGKSRTMFSDPSKKTKQIRKMLEDSESQPASTSSTTSTRTLRSHATKSTAANLTNVPARQRRTSRNRSPSEVNSGLSKSNLEEETDTERNKSSFSIPSNAQKWNRRGKSVETHSQIPNSGSIDPSKDKDNHHKASFSSSSDSFSSFTSEAPTLDSSKSTSDEEEDDAITEAGFSGIASRLATEGFEADNNGKKNIESISAVNVLGGKWLGNQQSIKSYVPESQEESFETVVDEGNDQVEKASHALRQLSEEDLVENSRSDGDFECNVEDEAVITAKVEDEWLPPTQDPNQLTARPRPSPQPSSLSSASPFPEEKPKSIFDSPEPTPFGVTKTRSGATYKRNLPVDEETVSHPSPPKKKKVHESSGGGGRRHPSSSLGTLVCDFEVEKGETCGKIFRRPYDLDRHKVTIHKSKGELPDWSCPVCENSFSRRDAMLRHQRLRGH